MKTKNLKIIAVLSVCALVSLARGASVLVPLETCGINPAAGREVVLTPVAAQGANEIPVLDKIQTNTDASGNVWLTLMPGVYQTQVRPAWGQVGITEFYFFVDPSNAVQDAFTNLLTGTNNTWPPNNYAYPASVSDARYVMASSTLSSPYLTTLLGEASVFTNVFDVKQYGAFGDGQFVSDISVTGGVGVVTSPFGHWGSTNVNNEIGLCACGTNAMTWYTTIASVVSPTQITVASAPPQGCTNGYYAVYGMHDDSSAIQTTINAASANGGGNVLFPQGIYLIETNFFNTNQNNCQLLIPNQSAELGPYFNSSTTIRLVGNHALRPWSQNANGYLNPSPDSTVLVGMLNGNDWTAGTNMMGSSLLDGRNYVNPNFWSTITGNNYIPDNDVCCRIQDIAFVTGYDPHLAVVNFIGLADGSGLDNVNIMGGNSIGIAFNQNPTRGTNSYGYIPPGSFEGQFGPSTYVAISGYYNDLEVGCFNGKYVTLEMSTNAIDSYLTFPPGFQCNQLQISDCPNILTTARNGSGGFGTVFDIDIPRINAGITGPNGGWWTNNGNNVCVINDPRGNFSAQAPQGHLFLYSTNIAGGAGDLIVTQLYNGIAVSYLGGYNPAIQHLEYPQAFDGGFTATTGQIGILGVISNLNLSGSIAVGGPVTTTNGIVAGSNSKNTTIQLYGRGVQYYGFSPDLWFADGNSQPLDEIAFGPDFNYHHIYQGMGAYSYFNWANGLYGGFQPIGNSAIYYYNGQTEQFEAILNSNAVFQAGGYIFAENTNYPYNLNGTFNINSVTNGMIGTNFWMGISNMSLVIVKYAGGTVTFSQLMQ